MSRPLSVSSSTAYFGSSIAICRISLRFFSPPEKPSLTEREVNERSMLEQIHLLVELRVVVGRLEFLALGQARLDRGAQEIRDRHAGDLARVLEGEEKALRARVRPAPARECFRRPSGPEPAVTV